MRRLTKRAMSKTSICLPAATKELWFAASKHQGVSQSEFLRVALHTTAARILVGGVSALERNGEEAKAE